MAIHTDIPVSKRQPDIAGLSLPPVPDHDDDISLLDLLIIFASRKRFIAVVTLIFGLVGLCISFLLPKTYTAVATLLPPKQNSSFGSALASQFAGLGGVAPFGGTDFGVRTANDMYVSMFRSQTVEDALIRQFGLMDGEKYISVARAKFENVFTINGNGKDGLLRISVRDGDPKRAAAMANAWIDEFRKLSASLAISEASQRRVLFERQMKQAKNDLVTAEEALKQTEQQTGMIQLDAQARALIESAATLRAQIAAKEVQLQAMRTYATDENAGVVQLQQELDGMRSQLARLGGSDDKAAAGLIVPKGNMPQAGLEYVRRFRDVKYYETIFEILARQFELAKVDEAKEGSLIQVVDPALVPDRKSGPRRGLITIGATAFGFFLAVIIVFVRAGLEHLHRNPETSLKLTSLRRALAFGHRR